MEKKYTPYKPKHGPWSGYPADVVPDDIVEVVFTGYGGVSVGVAWEFGWNKCDVMAYRKVYEGIQHGL